VAGRGSAGRRRPGRGGGRLGPALTCRPVNKSELESKHLSELHALAAEAGIERYRMLPRTELVEKLADGNSAGGAKAPRERGGEPNRRRSRKPREERKPKAGKERERRERPAAEPKPESEQPKPESRVMPATTPPPARPKRKRRRRRWGRRRKGVRVHDLLLPGTAGRQAIVYAENRAGCTVLLREVAAELSDASDGPDPIVLLVDPSPEELAEWKREAPQAEIVAAGKAQHAGDAIAQAAARAGKGEDVIVLIDSLSRFAETFAGADEARELFDSGTAAAGASQGSLTIVAAVERPQ
jgi:transcription termination factor Rho